MSSYTVNSYVNRQEADALKEMIFRRARERAEAMAQEINSSYTNDVQNDVMDLARASFRARCNPFSMEEPVKEQKEVKETQEISSQENTQEQIGFAPRKTNLQAAKIAHTHNAIQNKFTLGALEASMNDAKNEFRPSKNFTGALEFLNTQGSISLVNKQKTKFEAVA